MVYGGVSLCFFIPLLIHNHLPPVLRNALQPCPGSMLYVSYGFFSDPEFALVKNKEINFA
jgi:hypothetical protein